MKSFYLTFILASLILVSCDCQNSKTQDVVYKYSLGDVVYLKPDSLKGTVVSKYNYQEGNRYEIKYFNKHGEEMSTYVYEFEIFSSY